MQTEFGQKTMFSAVKGSKRLMARVAADKCAAGMAATEGVRSAQWQLALDFVAQSENLRCS
jgi:hypothetical protein